MKSLFLVSSPLEMICAIEARKHFKTQNNTLVLYVFDKDLAIIDYIMTLDTAWDEIHKPYRNSINYGKKWVTLTTFLKKDKYHYLFSTSMPFTAHFLFNIDYKEQYFIDDGTLTLNRVDTFNEKGNLTKEFSLFPGHNKTKIKHKINEVIHNLLGHKLSGKWENLSLFTFFDIKKSLNLSVVKNELNWFNTLKESENLVQINNTVYIIGTPLSEVSIISKNYYFSLLQVIKDYFSDKKMIYIPHRFEEQEKIDEIKTKFNFKIKPNKNIIEMDFLLNGSYPEFIVGTISTALFTLKKLYSASTVYSTGIDLAQVTEKKVAVIQSILAFQKDFFLEIPNK